ncbi:MAG: transketolase [Clostridia bacterium]|nr:transketolase [Clostridia bacterium]
MPLTEDEFFRLEDKARDLRLLTMDTSFWAGSAHVGGALSVLDILTILYYKYMKVDPQRPDWEDRDRFILSKGHAGVALASVFADKGYFDVKELETFNHNMSKFGMHLDRNKVKGLDASTGSLGHGLPIALGMALAAKATGRNYHVYTVLGDGECDEGSVWEAAMACAHYKAGNLTAFVDRNGLSIDGATEEVMALEPFADKWKAFGFQTLEVYGHDMRKLSEAIDSALAVTDKPTMIICRTVKSCGISEWEGNYKWHYAGINEDTRDKSKESIRKYHAARRGK